MINKQAAYRRIADLLGCSKQYVFMVDQGLRADTPLNRNIVKALDAVRNAESRLDHSLVALASQAASVIGSGKVQAA